MATILRLHQFKKDEGEGEVALACFLLVDGENVGLQHLRVSEEELPENWSESDLVAYLARSPEAARFKATAERGPAYVKPEPVEDVPVVADADPE